MTDTIPSYIRRLRPSRPLQFFLPFLFALLSLSVTSPVHGQGFQYITAPEVKNMIENDPRVVVINALSSIEYNGLHITGSINIPVINFRTSKALPEDKSTPIITYCMGHN